MSEEQAVGVPDIASKLRVSADTIYRLARRGDIPGFKVGAEWRFFPSKVIARLESPRDPWAQPTRSITRRRAA